MIPYEELRNILNDDTQVIAGEIPEEYLSDVLQRLKGTAEAVVKPKSTKEVSAILKWSQEHQIPVTPRGAGTNLVGSTVPDHGGIVLDLSGMNRILELDPERRKPPSEEISVQMPVECAPSNTELPEIM